MSKVTVVKSEKNWQAAAEAAGQIAAEGIKADKPRYKLAIRKAKKMAEDKAKEVSAMKKISKLKVRKKK